MSETRYPDRVEPGFGYRLLVRLRGQKHAPLSRCGTAAQLLTLGAEYVTLLLAAVCFVLLAFAIYGSMPLIVKGLPIAVAVLVVGLAGGGFLGAGLMGALAITTSLAHTFELVKVLRKPGNGPGIWQRLCRTYGEPGLEYAGPDIPWDIRNLREQVEAARRLKTSGGFPLTFIGAVLAAVSVLGTGLYLVLMMWLETVPEFATIDRPMFLLASSTGTLGGYGVLALIWIRVHRRMDEICKHAE